MDIMDEEMYEETFSGKLITKHDTCEFLSADAYPDHEGNVLVKFDDNSYLTLTPVMAKKLVNSLNEAIESAIEMILSEKQK